MSYCGNDSRLVTTAHQRHTPSDTEGGSDRSLIDQIMHHLVSRHRRHPSILFRQSSAAIARELRRGTRDHQFDHVLYLAIAVTANVFTSGKHQPVPVPQDVLV